MTIKLLARSNMKKIGRIGAIIIKNKVVVYDSKILYTHNI